ncbi:MAG: lysozyme [Methylobacillus sp.]|jgi:GH24 family phage-related lysozyme (muramidase)|nr:lysozyme [Methylobacillus sp.]
MSRAKTITAAVTIATSLGISAEGLRQFAYYDPGGVLTVCYGSTARIDKNKRYTFEECRMRLDADMLAAVETVERCVPGLPEYPLAAFGDAVYNLGPKIACDVKNSTAARFLKAGDISAACNQLPRWNWARVLGVMVQLPGLTARRELEKQVCLGDLSGVQA